MQNNKNNLSLLNRARKGIITTEIKQVAQAENRSPEYIRENVANGKIAICANLKRKITPLGVGCGLRTKVNANIGTSKDKNDLDFELKKLQAAVDAGADTVMDLSTGGDIRLIRRKIIGACNIPVGTVPIYQAIVDTVNKKQSIAKLEPEKIFDVIEEQLDDGVDFITVHCGLTQNALERIKKSKRILPIVSRGGSFLAEWMILTGRENPLYEQYDRLLNMANKYNAILSLGDGLRPGAIADATDRAQLQELITLGELTDAAWEKGVGIIVEGPGHVPLDQIKANVILQKRLCKSAPFYVLGPLVTDIAPGYDHIVGAIGGAIAALAGADFLCYVTPAEHLRLPNIADVKDGVIASRIAAHAADVSKGNTMAINQDYQMSHSRNTLDWSKQIALSIDPKKTAELSPYEGKGQGEVCSMCGEFCAIKKIKAFFSE